MKSKINKLDVGTLRTACFKLRSVQALISNQDQYILSELDQKEIWYGLGLIIGDIHTEFAKHVDLVERLELTYLD